MNHQPCDNGKPKCGICTKHNKSCLYLRPTKRRGPQKGYRTALNTYKESAAAWGAVLGAIPGLEALIEGHLRGDAGKAVVASIKNANHQEALITNWQQSSVFKAFFGYNGPPPTGDIPVPSPGVEDEGAGDDTRPVRRPPFKRASQPASQRSQRSQSVATFAMPEGPQMAASLGSPFQVKDSASLSDIVAKDAAQAYGIPIPWHPVHVSDSLTVPRGPHRLLPLLASRGARRLRISTAWATTRSPCLSPPSRISTLHWARRPSRGLTTSFSWAAPFQDEQTATANRPSSTGCIGHRSHAPYLVHCLEIGCS